MGLVQVVQDCFSERTVEHADGLPVPQVRDVVSVKGVATPVKNQRQCGSCRSRSIVKERTLAKKAELEKAVAEKSAQIQVEITSHRQRAYMDLLKELHLHFMYCENL
uniref:Uncharacterized protein n=1 Tax=Noctiluca scintillans TaxID=2966 RepID=A0A7S1F635_NOCSC|mmetsp:Transcript_35543/g.94575  ORF Transcript_35543/g.94575 Transcript_35543/m.94575 type:complete len:107 (+) Transcript_35543:265-585(+)